MSRHARIHWAPDGYSRVQRYGLCQSSLIQNNNNILFNNQIPNFKQYSFNNKNSNTNILYQQFFQMQNNYIPTMQQINPHFQIMNNYCINPMMLNINNMNETYNQQKKKC